MSQYHYLFKLIVIGDSGVGKSSTVLQFVQQKINKNHDATIGVQFAAKSLKLNKKTIKLQIWDTAGQQNFKSITRSYYRSAIGALLVYDITKKQTFQHIKDWLQQMKQNGNPLMQILLIGNKTDLEEEREVTYEQGKYFAEKEQVSFMQISAKQNKKVQNAFHTLAQNIYKKLQKGQISQTTIGIKIPDQFKIGSIRNNDKKFNCC